MEEIVFPNQIRMFRRIRGETMKSLADILGLSLSAISKIEKGYRRIDEKQLNKISVFLDCPKESLFVYDKSSQPEVINAWKKEQDRRRKINSGSGLKTLGAGLRYLRGEKSLTLNGVARGSKLTLSVYHRIEMGQREVDEKTFKNIAHALGFSETDLQLRIYELDISGALDELKQTEKKKGIFNSKGGYNDLPITRFMMRHAESNEITVPIYGIPTNDGYVLVNKENPTGSIVCPSTLSKDSDLYAVRLKTPLLGPIIPLDSVLIVSPGANIKNGDLALMTLPNMKAKPVLIQENDFNTFKIIDTVSNDTQIKTKDETIKTMHHIAMIVFP